MATDEIIEGSLNSETTSPFDSRHLSRRVNDLECRDGSRLCENPIGAMILLLNRRGK